MISTSHRVKDGWCPGGGETCAALFLRFWATAIHPMQMPTPLSLAAEGPCANALQRPGASLWQDAGAPAGWADGQVGTSHFVQAPSMRPIHATATSRAIHVPASMTKRGMIPLALSRPSPSALYRTGQGTRSPSERPNNTLAAFLRDSAVPDHSRGNTRRSEDPGSQPRLRKTRRSRRTLRAPL